jgi:hypothetical protein
MSLQILVFIAQRLEGTRPTREFRAGQNGSNQPFSHGKNAENKNALFRALECLFPAALCVIENETQLLGAFSLHGMK